MKHIYTSLDIGSDTIKVVVCELYQNRLNLLASSSIPSKGIKKGLITDVELATESVSNAIKEVEDKLGIRARKVIVSIPSFNVEYSVIKGSIKIESEDGIVSNDDIVRVLEVATTDISSNLREIIAVLPVDFILDDKEPVKDPKGMRGRVLNCRAVLATTPKKNAYSVVGLLESIGVEVVDISLNSIGDMYSFNNKKFEDKIGAIINVGCEVTNISLFNKGILVKSSLINVGGRSIDSMLSQTYKLDIPTAKNLKMKFALAHKKDASVNDIIEVKSVYDSHLKLNQFEVSEVIQNKLEEILNEAKKEINLLTSRKIDYIIITGGTSNMQGFEYVVNDVFSDSAHIGNVKLLGIRDNIYSSCIGNIVYFISKLKIKGKDYTMINDNEVYQMTSVTARKLSSSESMLGKIFGFFFSE